MNTKAEKQLTKYGDYTLVIKEIFDEYDYANVDVNKYTLMVNKAMDDARAYVEQIDDREIDNIFKDLVVKQINEYIRNSFNDKDKFFTIVSNYIAKNLKPPVTHIESLKNIKNLVTFFNDINILPTEDILEKLFKDNPIIEESLKVFTKDNAMMQDESEVLFSNDIGRYILNFYYNNISLRDKKRNSLVNNGQTINAIAEGYYYGVEQRLTVEETESLIKKVMDGDKQSYEDLFKRYFHLIAHFANKYLYTGIDANDIIQSGYVGLLNAIEIYKNIGGQSFYKCAYASIKREIKKAVNDMESIIQIPYGYNDKVKLFRETGRRPTAEELAGIMNTTIEEVNNLYQCVWEVTDWDELVENEDMELTSSYDTIEDVIITSCMKDEIRKLLNSTDFSDREKKVIMLRFGLDMDTDKTLREVGKILNITAEAVRLIEIRALNKICRTNDILNFAIHMDNPDMAIKKIEAVHKMVLEEEKAKEKIRKRKEEVIEKKKARKVNNKKKIKKVKSIYEIFYKNTRDEVNSIIEKLDWSEKKLLVLRYGHDLENPINNGNWTKKNDDDFHKILIPKMKKMLKSENRSLEKHYVRQRKKT